MYEISVNNLKVRRGGRKKKKGGGLSTKFETLREELGLGSKPWLKRT